MPKKKGKEKKSQVEKQDFYELKDLLKYGHYVLLLLILFSGYTLRTYHLDYPVIGYHNWKVAHYITEARNFARRGFFKEGFFVPMRDSFGSFKENPSGAHADTFPTISIVVGLAFKLFGESIIVARLINIFFSLGAVLAFYFLVKELFERESLALLAAFLAAINPLYVFFSHNVQVVNPGLFFMLLGFFFFTRWVKNLPSLHSHRLLYLSSFFIMLGAATKYTFAVAVFPIFFIIPYRYIWENKKKLLVPLIIAGMISSLFPLWMMYSEFYIEPIIQAKYHPEIRKQNSLNLLKLIKFEVVFDKSFWKTMKLYVADNYTLLGMGFAFLGAGVFLLLFMLKNSKKIGYRFMLGYLAAAPVFLLVMGFKLSGHSYHQFPMAPLILFLIAFLMVAIGSNIANLAKNRLIKDTIFISVILLFLLLPFSSGKNFLQHTQESINRMFDTQFPGLDLAGEYIDQHALPNETLFHSSHQSFGVLWHARRKGYKPPGTVEDFKEAEKVFNVSWVLVYQWGLQNYFQRPEIFSYLKANYHIAQFAFFSLQSNRVQPIYFLLRKGGVFNESSINEMLSGTRPMVKRYERTGGPYELLYINGDTS